MKTIELLKGLSANGEKTISFTLNEEQLVPNHYHVTEVIATKTTSIDCGGNIAYDTFTNIQLWTGSKKDDGHRLTAQKFAGILKKAVQVGALDLNTSIFFEFGDEHFHTTRLAVETFDFDSEEIEIKLALRKTACKPALELATACGCGPAGC